MITDGHSALTWLVWTEPVLVGQSNVFERLSAEFKQHSRRFRPPARVKVVKLVDWHVDVSSSCWLLRLLSVWMLCEYTKMH